MLLRYRLHARPGPIPRVKYIRLVVTVPCTRLLKGVRIVLKCEGVALYRAPVTHTRKGRREGAHEEEKESSGRRHKEEEEIEGVSGRNMQGYTKTIRKLQEAYSRSTHGYS